MTLDLINKQGEVGKTVLETLEIFQMMTKTMDVFTILFLCLTFHGTF